MLKYQFPFPCLSRVLKRSKSTRKISTSISPPPLSPGSATISLQSFPVLSSQFVETLREIIPRQEGKDVNVGLRSLPGHVPPAILGSSYFILFFFLRFSFFICFFGNGPCKLKSDENSSTLIFLWLIFLISPSLTKKWKQGESKSADGFFREHPKATMGCC